MRRVYATPPTIGLRSNVTLTVRDAATKRVLRVVRTRNLVVDSGLNSFRDMIGGTGFRPDTVAVGTSAVAVAAGDVALAEEIHRQTIDRRIKASKAITVQALIGQNDAIGLLAEQGIFESSILIARSLISPAINKTNSIELTVAHEFTLTAI